MVDIKLDHCVVHISDWERSNRFYSEVMGAETVPVGSGWAYRFGETQLNCHGPNVHATPVAKIPVAPGGSDLCFIWPGDIDSAIDHLRNHDPPEQGLLCAQLRRSIRRQGTLQVFFTSSTTNFNNHVRKFRW